MSLHLTNDIMQAIEKESAIALQKIWYADITGKVPSNNKTSRHKNKVDDLKALEKNFLDAIKEDANVAHNFLEKLAEKLNASKFGVSYRRDDTPVLRAGFFLKEVSDKPINSDFQSFILASVRKNGKLIAGERNGALWKLSEYYENSPIEFKCEAVMSFEEYAFWMRTSLSSIEKIFCQEIFDCLMKYAKHDPAWRIFSTNDGWIDIDMWKFMVEVDLT